jgi:hypothetical protein
MLFNLNQYLAIQFRILTLLFQLKANFPHQKWKTFKFISETFLQRADFI